MISLNIFVFYYAKRGAEYTYYSTTVKDSYIVNTYTYYTVQEILLTNELSM